MDSYAECQVCGGSTSGEHFCKQHDDLEAVTRVALDQNKALGRI